MNWFAEHFDAKVECTVPHNCFVYKGASKLFLEVGSRRAWWGIQQVELDAAPVFLEKDGTEYMYIPLRSVLALLGAHVSWDPE